MSAAKREQEREKHPHRRVREVGRLPFDDALLALGGTGRRSEDEEPRSVRVDACRERRSAHGDGEAGDALPRRDGADRPPSLDGLDDDDDHEQADARDETGMQVRPQQKQRGQQPPAPAAGAQVRLGDPERPADQREGEHLGSRAEHRLRGTGAEGKPDGEHHRAGAAKTPAQHGGDHGAPGDEPHQHGHEEQSPDRSEGGEDRLRQPFVRNQRIAECRVGEQLAGRNLVVGDDPVAEPDMPPDIRVAQRVETDGRRSGAAPRRAARCADPKARRADAVAAWAPQARRPVARRGCRVVMRAQRRCRAAAKTDRGRLATDSYTPRDGHRNAVSEAAADVGQHQLAACARPGRRLLGSHDLLASLPARAARRRDRAAGDQQRRAHRHQRGLRLHQAASTAASSACRPCWR